MSGLIETMQAELTTDMSGLLKVEQIQSDMDLEEVVPFIVMEKIQTLNYIKDAVFNDLEIETEKSSISSQSDRLVIDAEFEDDPKKNPDNVAYFNYEIDPRSVFQPTTSSPLQEQPVMNKIVKAKIRKDKNTFSKLALLSMIKLQRLSYRKSLLLHLLKGRADSLEPYSSDEETRKLEKKMNLELDDQLTKTSVTQFDVDKNTSPGLDNMLKCNLCHENFDKNLMAQHLTTHFRESIFPCDNCTKIFQSNDQLSRHLKVHKMNLKYSCKFCKNVYFKKWSLHYHVKVKHYNVERNSCIDCHKQFGDQDKLVAHLRFIHGVNRPFVCEICHKTFSLKIALGYHLKRH